VSHSVVYRRAIQCCDIHICDIVVCCRFVFIMGTSIAMSFHSARRRGASKSKLFLRILRRTAVLFMLGLALSNHGMYYSTTTMSITTTTNTTTMTF